MCKVSVVVPIYNTEKYIECCANSLLNQTLNDIELIFVNDCTPDNSIKILEKVLAKYPNKNTKIISHTNNKGSAASRNTGLKNANGEFIIHCDSDDWFKLDALELLYNTAIKTNADIVICDMYCARENYIKHIHSNPPLNNQELITSLFNGKVHASLCNKLIKREIYTKNNIECIEGVNFLEDMSVMYKLVYFSSKIEYINKPLYYYYQANYNSYTKTQLSEQSQIGILKLIEDINKFFNECTNIDIKKSIMFLIISCKATILLNGYPLINTTQLNRYIHFKDIICHPTCTFARKLITILDLINFNAGVKLLRLYKRLR